MGNSVRVQMLKTIATLMTTAFAFVAGLAWNEAIKSLINDFISAGSATVSLLIYALLVTIIAVLVTVFIGRSLGKVGIELDEE